MPNVTVKFEMTDGRTIECRYGYAVTRGNYSGLPENCYPDEVDIGEPDYYIDGEWVNYNSLPKGLDAIADAMYEEGEGDDRFTYSEADGDDYDDAPDLGDYDYAY